jgi:RND family efflux transporter MFP subunit
MPRTPFPRRVAALVAALAAAGCGEHAPPAVHTEPPTVLVAAPVEKQVTDYADYTGRTDAVESVDVRARVNGYLAEIKFESGKEVQKGDLLFVIDERPYKAALERSESQIKLAEAKLTYAAAEVARNQGLVKSGATTQAEFDKLVADKDQAVAAVAAAKAAAEVDRLNLGFCRVTSPIDGRISRNYLTVGNLVVADTTLLTTVVSQDPMYVYFDVDEATLLRIQKLVREGKFKSSRRHNDVPIAVGLANEPGRFPHQGRVDFVDNRVDPTTGTLKVRAVLPNPVVTNEDRVFTAGLFVRVRVPLGVSHPALLVSERAVGTDQGQKFVFVVNDKNEVALRPVTLGQMHDGLRVVESGLKGGEKIIVVGLQRVRPGATVTPKPGEMVPNQRTEDRGRKTEDRKQKA